MSNLSIIPARSGSKGIKDKNIKYLCGKPLMAYTIEAAKESNLFDEIMVSTDSEKYAKIAMMHGADVPFLRDENLSSDTSSSLDVVKNVINQYKKANKEFDTITLLQPTSPLRTSKDIIDAYRLMEEKNANSIVTVCQAEHSPLWSNTLPIDLSLVDFINDKVVNKSRQNLPIYYRINGALYLMKTEYLMKIENIYQEKSFALIMPKIRSVDIDDMFDFIFAESLLKYLKNNY